MKAADDCNDRVAARLLRSGANVNRADVYRKTPLMLAAESNCVRVVAVLLSQPKERVQIHARDQNFKEAFDYASHPWIQSMLAQYKQKTKRNNAPTVIIGTRRN
jgi:ankyrin repeat protein